MGICCVAAGMTFLQLDKLISNLRVRLTTAVHWNATHTHLLDLNILKQKRCIICPSPFPKHDPHTKYVSAVFLFSSY